RCDESESTATASSPSATSTKPPTTTLSLRSRSMRLSFRPGGPGLGVVVRAGEERPHVRVRRVLHLLGRPLRLDSTPAQEGHPVGDREAELELVGDDDRGDAQALLERADQLADAALVRRVEARRRLVVEDHARLERDAARDADALAHAARE